MNSGFIMFYMVLCGQTQKGWTSEIPANVEFDDDMYKSWGPRLR